MPEEERMQIEAFCFESQAIEPAQSAHQHAGDHFFCPEEFCLVEVRPAKIKNFFFRALKGKLHHPECRYHKDPKEDNGPGDPRPQPTPDPQTLIPTRLGPPGRRVPWKRPSLEELLVLVQGAKRRPALVPGTLEEVVSAWQGMTEAERLAAPLTISDQQMNYGDAFVFLAKAGDEVTDLPWGERIIFGAAVFRHGKAKGYLFVNPVRRLVLRDERLPFGLIVRPEHHEGRDDRAYVRDIPDESRGTLFWRGPSPQPTSDGKRLDLSPPDDELYHGFALRAEILAG
ncbi:MAG: hypothetical protein HQL34_13965 [Alphaproteobacteria bacterium]|nr:hypothetical protein [Alphaproteobacteria bacterium]